MLAAPQQQATHGSPYNAAVPEPLSFSLPSLDLKYQPCEFRHKFQQHRSRPRMAHCTMPQCPGRFHFLCQVGAAAEAGKLRRTCQPGLPLRSRGPSRRLRLKVCNICPGMCLACLRNCCVEQGCWSTSLTSGSTVSASQYCQLASTV